MLWHLSHPVLFTRSSISLGDYNTVQKSLRVKSWTKECEINVQEQNGKNRDYFLLSKWCRISFCPLPITVHSCKKSNSTFSNTFSVTLDQCTCTLGILIAAINASFRGHRGLLHTKYSQGGLVDSCNSPSDTNKETFAFVLRKFNRFKNFWTLLFAFLLKNEWQWQRRNPFSDVFFLETKITHVLGPYFTMMQSTKGSPGGKTRCFHSNHDWLLVIITTFSLGTAPSALWDWDFPPVVRI